MEVRFTTSRVNERKYFERKIFFSFLCIPKYKHIPCLILQLLLVAFMLNFLSHSRIYSLTLGVYILCAIINNCIVKKKIRVY